MTDSHKDCELSEDAQAWRDTALMYARNAEYYKGLVVRIGDLFAASRIADDGSLVDAVLAEKVPELVEQLVGLIMATDSNCDSWEDNPYYSGYDNGRRSAYGELQALIKNQ